MTLTLDKCCGCINLRTGSFIIGYLSLIGNIIIIAIDIVLILVFRDSLSSHMTTQKEMLAYTVFVVSCVSMIILAVALVFSILLVVGLHKEKRGFVKAYLIYATILIVLHIMQFLAFNILMRVAVWRIIMDMFSILLNMYFLLCLRSHYLYMTVSSLRPTVHKIA